MGCDIHAYIEFYSSDLSPSWGRPLWNLPTFCFAGNIPFGRNYPLFSLIAGVRNHTSAKQLYANKKISLNMNPMLSDECKNDYYVRVLENKVYEESKGYFRETKNVISRDEFLEKEKDGILVPESGSQFLARYISNHSSTYLNLHELMHVRKELLIYSIESDCDLFGKPVDQSLLQFISSKTPNELMKYNFDEYEDNMLYTTLKSMQSLEICGRYKTRFVCWFDS